MKVIYIAGKYSDKAAYKVKQNIYRAEMLGMEIVKRFGDRGVMVIVPHTNTAGWEGIQSDQWFYDATLELLKRSDACIYIPGDYDRSKGTKGEVEWCKGNCRFVTPGNTDGFAAFDTWLTEQGL